MAGLAAGQVLSDSDYSFRLLEQQDGPGGLVRTDHVAGYLFDRGGHFIHARSDKFRSVLDSVEIEFNTHKRKSAVLLGEDIVPYPVQYNTWACPIEFRELVRSELGDLIEVDSDTASLEEMLRGTWGDILTQAFFRPYLEKMWGRSLAEIPPNWGSRFVPERKTELVYKGMSEPVLDYGYNSFFLYPASGRIGELPEVLLSKLDGAISFNSKIVSIDGEAKTATLDSGEIQNYSRIVSTVPLNQLLTILGRDQQVPFMSYSNLLNVRVGFKGKLLRKEHWYYIPDKSVPFFRVGFPANFSDQVCPKDCFSLSLEYGLGEMEEPAIAMDDMVPEVLDYLAATGVLEWESIDVVDSQFISPAYVAHRMPVTPELQQLAADLESQGIFLAGRYGAWDYLSLEEAYLSGAEAAERLLSVAFRGITTKSSRNGCQIV